MDVTRSILAKHLPVEIFIGKSKQYCYLARLNFDRGYVTWIMDSQVFPIATPAGPQQAPNMYFSSFFGFTDYIESINKICRAWIQYNFILERVNLLADLFKEYFPWMTFILHCPVEKLNNPITLKYSEFGSESFVRYLQQVLPLQNLIKAVMAGEKAMTYFLQELLVKTGFNLDPAINLSVGEVLMDEKLPVEKLDLAVKAFYREYVNTWQAKLKLVCQPRDKHDVQTAIVIAGRSGLSALAIHRYLAHREQSVSKTDQEKLFREARLAKFQGN